MKIERSLELISLVFGLTLAGWPDAAKAQTATMPMPPGAIQAGGDPTDTTLDWGIWWTATGVGNEVFDPTNSSSTDIPGSIHVTMVLPAEDYQSNAANLCMGDFIVGGIGNNGWLGADQSSAVDFSLYSALSFDIMINLNACSNAASIPINLFDWNYDQVQIGSVPVTTNAGWQHYSIPIPTTFTFGDTNAPPPDGTAWGFYEWSQGYPFPVVAACLDFWIDNVQLVGEGYIPPPTLKPPVKAVPGLNAFATTEQNQFWDRQEVMLVASNGLSWVGRATSAKPVSYSFTIDGFPSGTNVPYNATAQMFLAPNPATEENAPDWGETNCAMITVVSTPTGGGQMTFLYKVDQAGGNSMFWGNSPYTNAPGSWDGVTPNYLESGDLTNVQSASLLGTWTVQFTSDTNGMLIAPDGTTSSFIFPPYNATKFTDSTSFNVYLGMVANVSDAINQGVAFSSFAISNAPSACSDNFLADTSLNTSLWTPSYAIAPQSVLLVPSGAPYWMAWTLPAHGFSLADSASLGTSAVWNNVTTYAPMPMYGTLSQQLISTNDLTSTNAEFFAMIQRTFTQLLILLPGETNAPNTATGITGTPTPVDLLSGTQGGAPVTVLAVDSHFNPVGGVTDTITLTSTDSGGVVLNGTTSAAMVNGSVQFNWYFGNPGTQTVTATDSSNTSIPPVTTPPVSVLYQ